jgi:two-component system, response regulator PdtaR
MGITHGTAPAEGSVRILVCEDESLTALCLQKALALMGHLVVGEARDGEEAVTLAECLRPDVILMDVRMPRLDGIEATNRIMRMCPTAIIMVTAYSDEGLVRQALDAGASGYLVKPVRDDQLQPAISVARTRFTQFKELVTELKDLKETLEVRKVVERAKGILMQRRKLSEEEAYRQMQRVSRNRRQSLREIAQHIITAAELLD